MRVLLPERFLKWVVFRNGTAISWEWFLRWAVFRNGTAELGGGDFKKQKFSLHKIFLLVPR